MSTAAHDDDDDDEDEAITHADRHKLMISRNAGSTGGASKTGRPLSALAASLSRTSGTAFSSTQSKTTSTTTPGIMDTGVDNTPPRDAPSESIESPSGTSIMTANRLQGRCDESDDEVEPIFSDGGGGNKVNSSSMMVSDGWR